MVGWPNKRTSDTSCHNFFKPQLIYQLFPRCGRKMGSGTMDIDRAAAAVVAFGELN